MGASGRDRQACQPTRIIRLEQHSNGSGGTGTRYQEALLQKLVHSSPDCLPVEEIEPAFVGLRSVCTELPLRRDSKDRYADNLLISPSGRICLVECKLASNGEADREVLSQLIDYAASLVELDYEGLLDRVKKATRTSDGDPIVEAVLGPETDLDRCEDLRAGIERSLGRGELLLLIVGDRIRPNTTQLVQVLQEHIDLGFLLRVDRDADLFARRSVRLSRPAVGGDENGTRHPDGVRCQ